MKKKPIDVTLPPFEFEAVKDVIAFQKSKSFWQGIFIGTVGCIFVQACLVGVLYCAL